LFSLSIATNHLGIEETAALPEHRPTRKKAFPLSAVLKLWHVMFPYFLASWGNRWGPFVSIPRVTRLGHGGHEENRETAPLLSNITQQAEAISL